MTLLPNPPAILPLAVNDGSVDVIGALATWAFASGSYPVRRWARLSPTPTDLRSLLPEGFAIVREDGDDDGVTHLMAESGTAIVTLARHGREYASATILARDSQECERILSGILGLVPPKEQKPEEVELSLWYRSGASISRVPRPVVAPAWAEIRRNYPAAVGRQLDELVRAGNFDGGKLVLLHGPPGTGKTRFLISWARELASWADMEFLTDPEQWLGDAGYLMSVASHGHRSGRWLGEPERDPGRWRVLVAEDCDELITIDAKRRSGPGLGRLLNLTDGVLGIAERIAVVLTTNEPVTRLHPAILRPGRCLADIAFTAFPAAEARAWLGGPVPSQDQLTLAELYRAQGDITTLGRPDASGADPGQYL